jgi:GNAT superfamily N-acetyltransferase
MDENWILIQDMDKAETAWLHETARRYWGSTKVVSREKLHDLLTLPGLVAFYQNKPAGWLAYHINSGYCEIVSLISTIEGVGIGSKLISSVKSIAIQNQCTRLWLTTTNDNLPALYFYQKRGFHLKAVYPDALEKSRKLKPEIPLIGHAGIPIRDEIELEMNLPD